MGFSWMKGPRCGGRETESDGRPDPQPGRRDRESGSNESHPRTALNLQSANRNSNPMPSPLTKIRGRRPRLAVLATICAGLIAVLGALSASAAATAICTDDFNGSVSSDWATAENWTSATNSSVHLAPTSTDVACLAGESVVITGGPQQADSVQGQGGSLQITGGSLTLASTSDNSTISDLSLDGEAALSAPLSQTVQVTGNFEWGGCTPGCSSPPLDATIEQTGGGSFSIDGDGGFTGPDFTGGSISTSSPVNITNGNFASSGAETIATTNTVTLGPNVQLNSLSASTTITAAGVAPQTGNYGFWSAGLVLTGGTTTVPANGVLEAGSITVEGGTLVVDGGTQSGAGAVSTTTLTGGTLTGSGSLGNVANVSGTVEVPHAGSSATSLEIRGNYTQDAGGTLTLGLPTEGLTLDGSGTQTLGGSLSLTNAGGYTPAPGTDTQPITAQGGPIVGTFAQLTGPAAFMYTAQYAPQAVDLFANAGSQALPVNTAPPAIAGTPAAGDTLTCTTGVWSPPPTGYGYQWNRDGSPIPGATDSTYLVAVSDEGHSLTCTVIASDAAGPTLPETSAPVSVAMLTTTTTTTTTPTTITRPASTAGADRVPVDVTAPAIAGTPTPGHALRCSTGDWTNSPPAYTYSWRENSTIIAARTTNAYPVQIGDEGSTITCTVTAANAAGAGVPAASAPVVVAQPGTLHCPKPTGHLLGTRIGPLALALTRSQARHRLTRYVVTHNNFDNFCLYGGWGIRVGYPSSTILRVIARERLANLAGTVVLALTANPFYALDGVRPGTPLSAVQNRLGVGRAFHIGLNYWYLTAGTDDRGVLKVRGGIIQEVGIANEQLTRGNRATQRTFLVSFTDA